MAVKITLTNQKGGVGKSALARTLAVTYANADANVLIADLDVDQQTSFDWSNARDKIASPLYKPVEVVVCKTLNQADRLSTSAQLLIYDTRPNADDQSIQAAKGSDLVVVPTESTMDALRPTVAYVKTMMDKGVDPERIIIVFYQSLSDSDTRNSMQTLQKVLPFVEVAKTAIQAKRVYTKALDEGKALTEAQTLGQRTAAKELMNEIVKKLKQVNTNG